MPELEYYHFFNGKIAGVDMIISRTGYTGELGYNSISLVMYLKLKRSGREYLKLEKNSTFEPVGLAARDSLRLEMGYCLYGNDIDQTTNPIEAGLGWITKIDKGNFLGKDAILKVRAGRSRS